MFSTTQQKSYRSTATLQKNAGNGAFSIGPWGKPNLTCKSSFKGAQSELSNERKVGQTFARCGKKIKPPSSSKFSHSNESGLIWPYTFLTYAASGFHYGCVTRMNHSIHNFQQLQYATILFPPRGLTQNHLEPNHCIHLCRLNYPSCVQLSVIVS